MIYTAEMHSCQQSEEPRRIRFERANGENSGEVVKIVIMAEDYEVLDTIKVLNKNLSQALIAINPKE